MMLCTQDEPVAVKIINPRDSALEGIVRNEASTPTDAGATSAAVFLQHQATSGAVTPMPNNADANSASDAAPSVLSGAGPLDKDMENLLHELEILGRLSHKNVVSFRCRCRYWRCGWPANTQQMVTA